MDENEGKNESCSPMEQTLADSEAVCQIPESYGEGFGNEPCNGDGDDIMVEVLGSEVYVGGVCTSGSGECSAGDAGEIYLDHGDAAVISERPANHSSDENARVSGQEDGIRNEGDSVVSVVVVTEEAPVEKLVMEVAGSSGGETRVNCCVGVDLITEEVVVEGQTQEVEGNTGDSGSQDAIKQEIEARDQTALVPELRNDDVAGLTESQIAGEDSVMACAEQDSKLVDDTVDASTKSKVENVGVSEVANETQVREESSLPVNHDEKGELALVNEEVVSSSTVSITEVDVEGGRSNCLVEKQDVTITEVVSVSEQVKSSETVEYFDNSMACDIEITVMDAEHVDFDGGQEGNIVSNTEVRGTTEHLNPEDHTNEAEMGNVSQFSHQITGETENQVNGDMSVDPMDNENVLISEIEVPEHCLDQGATAGLGYSPRNFVEEEDQKEQEEQNTSESIETGSSSVMQQPHYELPPEHDGEFSVPDLVWGKVKSHPWWPGQMFDFTDASEKAMKHHKKDCYLVAYFGDRTFAWNEASTLKSFQTHFSQMVSQSNGETFHNAVNCALEELSRRVELGLSCSCTPKDSHDEIRVQIVENAGIRSESSRRDEVDESAGVSFFRADKLVDFVKQLAQFPSGGGDHLGLAIAKAQLLAFSHFKGYSSLPEFQFCGELVENDTVGPRFHDEFEHGSSLSKDDEQVSSSQEILKVPNRFSHKRKHNLRDNTYPKVKEKSMSELMGGSLDYPEEDNFSGKRRKSDDDDPTLHDARKTTSLAKASTPPKQSFKIGECIRRVASQLTGSPSMKGIIQKPDEYDIFLQNSEVKPTGPTEYSSLDELLSQLQFIALDPLKEHNSSKVIINFFSDFRNSVIRLNQSSGEKVGAKRKKGSPETFEFDDMNDTYWTDRVIQNGAEEQQQPQPQPQQPQPRKYKKKDNNALTRPQKTPQEGRRPYNRKRYSNGDLAVTPQKPPGYVSENAPTELIMNFSDVKSMPSESTLNKMFRRFGALKETETEVDREITRARVVFKKCSDAEVAFNSARKFDIFGPTAVNYQLGYTPTLQYKPSPVIITHDHDHNHNMQLVLSGHDHDMQLDLSTHDHDMHLDLSSHDHEMHIDLSEFDVSLV